MLEGLPAERVEVDVFVLADGAQEAGGKLYILGGGWDFLRVAGPETPIPTIALAIRVVVPWNETNRPLLFDLQLEDPDGNHLIGGPFQLELNVGRPPGLPPGTPQAAPLTLNLNNVVFPRAGDHAFTLSLEDREVARTRFRVGFST